MTGLGVLSDDPRLAILSDHGYRWDLPTLTDVLMWLPGVSSRTANAMLDDLPRNHWPDLRECFLLDRFVNPRVSPAGAALLLRLYRDGNVLPVKKRRGAGDTGDMASIQALIARGPDIEERVSEMLAALRQREELVARPATVNLDEADYGLLNAIFRRHCNTTSGKLVIGGVDVFKNVSGPIFSNSRKTHDFDVSFSWTDPKTGVRKSFDKDGKFSSNRSNDPDRNWGLGRE